MTTKKLIGHFLRGLLLVAPLAITLYVIVAVIQKIDQLVPNNYPGLGLLIFVVGITIMGYISSTLFFKPVFTLAEKLITKTPLVKIIYTSIKDLFAAFVSEKKKFNQPVLVTVSKESNLQKLGFITQEDLSKLGIHDKVAVYLPHSYNFSGNLFIVSRENITPVKGVSTTAIMKFIVSGGITDIDSIQ